MTQRRSSFLFTDLDHRRDIVTVPPAWEADGYVPGDENPREPYDPPAARTAADDLPGTPENCLACILGGDCEDHGRREETLPHGFDGGQPLRDIELPDERERIDRAREHRMARRARAQERAAQAGLRVVTGDVDNVVPLRRSQGPEAA